MFCLSAHLLHHKNTIKRVCCEYLSGTGEGKETICHRHLETKSKACSYRTHAKGRECRGRSQKVVHGVFSGVVRCL